jgi:hypothetical protein
MYIRLFSFYSIIKRHALYTDSFFHCRTVSTSDCWGRQAKLLAPSGSWLKAVEKSYRTRRVSKVRFPQYMLRGHFKVYRCPVPCTCSGVILNLIIFQRNKLSSFCKARRFVNIFAEVRCRPLFWSIWTWLFPFTPQAYHRRLKYWLWKRAYVLGNFSNTLVVHADYTINFRRTGTSRETSHSGVSEYSATLWYYAVYICIYVATSERDSYLYLLDRRRSPSATLKKEAACSFEMVVGYIVV